MTDPTIATRARTIKASALAEALHTAGATSATIPYLDDDGWERAAQAAGVPAPSAATRTLVAGWLAMREQPVSDPFAGLADVA